MLNNNLMVFFINDKGVISMLMKLADDTRWGVIMSISWEKQTMQRDREEGKLQPSKLLVCKTQVKAPAKKTPWGGCRGRGRRRSGRERSSPVVSPPALCPPQPTPACHLRVACLGNLA